MTPFGEKIRQLRAERDIMQKTMAEELGVSGAYLSALEHGHRSQPGPGLIRQVCDYFALDWDEAEELRHLALRSHPKITVDTSGLGAKATELANLLAERISDLDDETIEWVLDEIKARAQPPKGPTH
ncbi:MAG: helix-turn-helix transcriptional regulator [Rhodospirillaceae bacterium]|jgi:transcriptional regulator with XRE-family HTH domain|nr:helix-turn-helix transcriptional regulator [Rhodospirillaceae bacterium]MBT4219309.1 helix-turn-helix transcriptional regulator [Rhodospirillaceae bacterium]MBT4464014.1 helix-turn-helix transcriptional regulator [Rhodospirillaceae bacterium]MBT5013737.1 helix-turn-helix transcriptional regulator [Rhodospirillaceae bacterium]MBT5308459.1 helix-turn-helix transcriptional regulator [Rhodospirillaceae bacterium]